MPHAIWSRLSPALPPSLGSLLDKPWWECSLSTRCVPAHCFFWNSVAGFKTPFADRQEVQAAPASPRLPLDIYPCHCRRLPAHVPALHLCKPLVEVMHGVFNNLGRRMLSLSHLLTCFYLLPVLGVMLHPPGFLPFPLYVKLCLNQSSSITFLLRSPG